MYFYQSIRAITSFVTRLEQWMPHSSERSRAELCGDGLHELRANAENYDACILASAFFRDELFRHLAEDVTDDVVFALIEDMAVLMREKTLRCSEAAPGEKKILEYFERSGNWEIGDGTLVSMFYHVYVPSVIERDRLCENMDRTPFDFQTSRKTASGSPRTLAPHGY